MGKPILLIAKGDLDRALESMGIPIVRSALVRLMLLHERQKLLGCPSLGLEVVIVGCGRAGIHLGRGQQLTFRYFPSIHQTIP